MGTCRRCSRCPVPLAAWSTRTTSLSRPPLTGSSSGVLNVQQHRQAADPLGMPPELSPLGLRLPPHTPCSPACPTCTMARLGDVERAVRDQVPEVGDPWVAAVLLVLGVPEQA